MFVITVKESCLVEIYTNTLDTFSVGKVFCQNNNCVVFENIDVQGKITGYYVMRKKIISQLDYNTEYLDKIAKYMEYAESHSYANWFSLKPITFDTKECFIMQTLEYAKENNTVITIGIIGIEGLEIGYVKEVKPDKIIFSCLDMSNAQLAEDIIVETDDIVFIEFESIDNLLLQYANTTL